MRSIILSMNKKLAIFLEFVEIRTKVVSVFPMLIGFMWAMYHYGNFNVWHSLVFFLAAVTFDMCTTAINNTMDYHKAIDLHYKVKENVIGVHQLSFKRMVGIVLTLLGISLLLSLILVVWTDPLLLVIGAVCFIIGIGYTFGPMPLSRLPLGEVFSSLTMGFGILFLAIYMTQYEQLLTSAWTLEEIVIRFNWVETARIFWWSLPLVSLTANIMLANNTCDLKTDIQNQRYTLVYYIGVKRAVRLYQLLSIIPWIVWATFIIAGQLPMWALIGYGLLIPHGQSLQRYSAKQVKSETFIESVKSFVMFATMYGLTLLVALLIR